VSEEYDEFGLLHENAAEWDLAFEEPPAVERGWIATQAGELSYLRWGEGRPEMVLLHGAGQNAHTWDTSLLAIGRPAIAFDLLGHGHSDRRADKDYGPWNNADAVAEALATLIDRPVILAGMSLGGATSIVLAARYRHLFSHVVIIDVTPQINDATREMTTFERGSVALLSGPPTYDTFEEMAEAAIALSPYRAPEGVRRGVRHNSVRRPDGRWTWRYDLFGPWPERDDGDHWSDFTTLWDDVAEIKMPAMLVRGALSKYVTDDDEAEMVRRLRSLRVEHVDGAGHAVQSDQPLRLAELINDFVSASDT
jgi:pimeloyl-ACP methyl ester carboxylesterase